MEQAKKLWALVLAHKKISIAVAVVIVIIIAVVIVTLGLLATFITYWTWYATTVDKLLVGCIYPALRNAYDVANDPATKNSSMLLKGIFKDCTYFVDVDAIEDDIYNRKIQ